MSGELVTTQSLLPDRGGTILALGIVSLAVSLLGLPCGIPAWVMGSRDLRAMKAGTRNPGGRQTTQAGSVIGMIGTGVGLLFAFLLLAVVVVSLSVPDTLDNARVIEAGW